MYNEFDNDFPIKLKMLRLDRGLSQEEFARRVGISRSCLANYETGKRQPDMRTIQKIAEVCNVMPEVLIDSDVGTKQVFSEGNKKNKNSIKSLIQSGGNVLDISHLPSEYKICMIEYYDYIRSKYQKKTNRIAR